MAQITEIDIELHYEHRTNALDRRFLSSSMTQEEYDAEIEAMDRWYCTELRKIAANKEA
jgi:hypothetical protein